MGHCCKCYPRRATLHSVTIQVTAHDISSLLTASWPFQRAQQPNQRLFRLPQCWQVQYALAFIGTPSFHRCKHFAFPLAQLAPQRCVPAAALLCPCRAYLVCSAPRSLMPGTGGSLWEGPAQPAAAERAQIAAQLLYQLRSNAWVLAKPLCSRQPIQVEKHNSIWSKGFYLWPGAGLGTKLSFAAKTSHTHSQPGARCTHLLPPPSTTMLFLWHFW